MEESVKNKLHGMVSLILVVPKLLLLMENKKRKNGVWLKELLLLWKDFGIIVIHNSILIF